MSRRRKSLTITDYLFEDEPLVNKFVSVPKDQSEGLMKASVWYHAVNVVLSIPRLMTGNLTCAAFIAGIIEGYLNGSQFVCDTHSQHTLTTHSQHTQLLHSLTPSHTAAVSKETLLIILYILWCKVRVVLLYFWHRIILTLSL